MIIEGYFDGTAVRPLEPVDLKPQQKVFIDIPEPQESAEERKKQQLAFLQDLADRAAELHAEEEIARKERQKKAVDDLFNLLSDNEAKAFGEEMKTMQFLSQTTRGILDELKI